ncbi:hypothetical protein BKA62DRAFT_494214 [Auriculariales sp. MPI-PUGE-AT-0066]|nr:hypothetical protein BKA62DRAFT_494214 [Auriculariales sp. MPI-PUGE-AT-0066]
MRLAAPRRSSSLVLFFDTLSGTGTFTHMLRLLRAAQPDSTVTVECDATSVSSSVSNSDSPTITSSLTVTSTITTVASSTSSTLECGTSSDTEPGQTSTTTTSSNNQNQDSTTLSPSTSFNSRTTMGGRTIDTPSTTVTPTHTTRTHTTRSSSDSSTTPDSSPDATATPDASPDASDTPSRSPDASNTSPSSPATGETTSTTSQQPDQQQPTSTTPLSTLTTPFTSTITGKDGKHTLDVPPYYTSVYTVTDSDGSVVTHTDVAVNPSGVLSPDTHHGGMFFHNRVAVAVVFVLAGIAVTAILLFIFFAYRRRKYQHRRKQRWLQQQFERHMAENAGNRTSIASRYASRGATSESSAALVRPDSRSHRGTGSSSAVGNDSRDNQIEVSHRPLSPSNFYSHRSLSGANPNGANSNSGNYSHPPQLSVSQYEDPPEPQDYGWHHDQQYNQQSYPGPHDAGTTYLSPLPPQPLVPHLRSSLYSDEYMETHSTSSLPTMDVILDPSHRRQRNDSYQGDELQDDVDYARRVWQAQPSARRPNV